MQRCHGVATSGGGQDSDCDTDRQTNQVARARDSCVDVSRVSVACAVEMGAGGAVVKKLKKKASGYLTSEQASCIILVS